jgi:hypothetical protein
MVQAFREGGVFMYVVLAVGILAGFAAVMALIAALTQRTRQPALVIGIVAMVLGLLIPVTGGVGYALAMRNAFAAVASVDPSMRAAMLAQGISEAMNLIVFSALCAALPMLLSFVAVVRAALRPKS